MKKYTLYILCTLMSTTFSGCSVINNIMGKSDTKTTVSGAQAQRLEKDQAPLVAVDKEAFEAAKKKAAEDEKAKSQKSREEIAEQIGQSADSVKQRVIPPVIIPPVQMASPDSTKTAEPKKTELSGVARIIGGSWTIIQVGNTIIDRDEDMPYIVFETSKGVFYANNGCNTLNGSYTMEGDKITFHNVLSTLRFCADVNFDHEINTIIADETPSTLKVSEIGSETIVEFVANNKVLMRLRRGNLEFLNGQWEITSVAGLATLKAPATVFFDLNDMKLHGNTGCNFINGEIYLDHRMANAVDFSNIITTLRMCEYPEQQTSILVALEETSSAISDGTDKVLLLDPEGKILLELKKQPINQ